MSKQWKGKTRGGTAGYRAFIFLLNYGGLSAAYFLLVFVAPYFVLFSPSARKPMYFYFRKVLKFGFIKSVGYLFLNNYRFGQVLIDKVAMLSGLESKFSFYFEGEEHLHHMAAHGGGFIVGAHMGNWEVAGNLLKRIDANVHIVMLEDEHEKIKSMLDDVMTEKSMKIIPIKEDMSHLFAMRSAMERNEIIAIHGDRFLPGSKVINMKFLGLEADFPAGPLSLVIRYNKPVTFISAMRTPHKHYDFFATAPKMYSNSRKNFSQTLKVAMGDYIKQLEKTIGHYPEQWFNFYYFWK